jgi:hypothetical protein
MFLFSQQLWILQKLFHYVRSESDALIRRNATGSGSYKMSVSFYKVIESIIFDVYVARDDNKEFPILFESSIPNSFEIKPIGFQFLNSYPKDFYFVKNDLSLFNSTATCNHPIYYSIKTYGTIISYEIVNHRRRISLPFEEYANITLNDPFFIPHN